MSEDTNKTKTLSLSGTGKLSLGGLDTPPRRGAEVSARRGKTVQVEVRRKRAPTSQIQRTPSASPEQTPAPPTPISPTVDVEEENQLQDGLTATERANRIAVLKQGIKRSEASVAALKEETNNSDLVEQEGSDAIDAVTKKELKNEEDPLFVRRRAELAELEEIEAQSRSQCHVNFIKKHHLDQNVN